MIDLINTKDYPIRLIQNGDEFILPPKGRQTIKTLDGLIGLKEGEIHIIDIFRTNNNKKPQKTTVTNKTKNIKKEG